MTNETLKIFGYSEDDKTKIKIICRETYKGAKSLTLTFVSEEDNIKIKMGNEQRKELIRRLQSRNYFFN